MTYRNSPNPLYFLKKDLATIYLTGQTLMTSNEIDAAICYYERRMRYTHPSATWDDADRVYLEDHERCACCSQIRSPSRAWPYSELKHARSVEHVANLFAVDVGRLRVVGASFKRLFAPEFGLPDNREETLSRATQHARQITIRAVRNAAFRHAAGEPIRNRHLRMITPVCDGLATLLRHPTIRKMR